MTTPLQFSSWSDVGTVVRKFEQCEYLPGEFTHAHHLAVAAWYLRENSPHQTLEKLRSSLLHFTAHHKVKAYHETITRFWIEIVALSLASSSAESPINEVNQFLQRHSNKDEIFRYYSRERLQSDEARERWIEPDLHSLSSLEPAPGK